MTEKIGQIKEKILALEMFDLSTNEKERDLVDSKQVATILAEAKKEFPTISKIVYGRNHPIPRLATEVGIDLSVDVEQLEKWFLKQFGEP